MRLPFMNCFGNLFWLWREKWAGFAGTLPGGFPEETESGRRKNRREINQRPGNEPEFNEMYKLVRKNLKTIDSQEITLESVLNEEYDDWNDDCGEEFYYKDESGIGDMLAEACDFIHTCMDMEKYKEGYEIGNQMFSKEVGAGWH